MLAACWQAAALRRRLQTSWTGNVKYYHVQRPWETSWAANGSHGALAHCLQFSSSDNITNQSNIKACNDERAHEWEPTHSDHDQSTWDIIDKIDKDHQRRRRVCDGDDGGNIGKV